MAPQMGFTDFPVPLLPKPVVLEQLLHHPLLERPFPAGEQVGAFVLTLTQVGPQEFGGMPPQRLLPSDSVLEPSDPDTVCLEVEILQRDGRGFVHSQPVVIDERKECPVAWGLDHREEVSKLVLGEVFGKGTHEVHGMRICRLALGAAGPHALPTGLLHVLAHQLGQLEHGDGWFPAKDGGQRGIRIDLALIPGIL
jgi:hypothetical protein